MKVGDAEKQRIERKERNTGLMERADGKETGLIITKKNPKSWECCEG